jgi:hypothetical protein
VPVTTAFPARDLNDPAARRISRACKGVHHWRALRGACDDGAAVPGVPAQIRDCGRRPALARLPHWVKVENRHAAATREFEEEWAGGSGGS